MKKLMTMLGIITLTVTPVVTLVSCGTNDEHLDENGNSIILDYGRPVGDKEDEITGLDSGAILEAIKGKPSFKNKLLEDVLSIVNSSFLKNLDMFFEKDEKDENTFNFYDDSTKDTLSNIWENVNDSIDRQIKDEKDSINDSDAWRDKLKAKFPNFEDESIEFLENKYKTSLLVDGEDNVESRIQKALIDSNHSGVTFINSDKLELIWNDHKKEIEKSESDYKDSIKKENNELLRKQFTQLYNAGLEIKNTPDATNVKNMFSVKDINVGDNLNNMFKAITTNWGSLNPTVNAVPDEIDNLSVKGTGVTGILSNSQNYFLNNYFETKAPIVMSEVKFAYSSNANFEEGIKADSINNYNGSLAASQITNFMNAAKGITNDRGWISLVSDPNFNSKYGVTPTKADKIMTIDDEQDSYLKSTVYDYVLNEGANKFEGAFDSREDGATVTDVPWLNNINRSEDKNLYMEVGKNLLVYLDSTGVHFIFLHGSISDNNNTGTGTTYNKLNTFQSNDGVKKISENLYNQQSDLNKFNELEFVEDKLAAVYEYKEGSDAILGSINSSINNKYAKYLINNSLTANMNGSYSTYDIVNNMKEWAKSNSSSSVDAKLTIFDYFKGLYGNVNDEVNDKNFLSEFIDFNPSDIENNKEAKELEDMIVTMIGTLRAGSQVTSAMAMEKQHNELNKTIDSIKDESITGTTKPPKGKFIGELFKADNLRNKIREKYQLFAPIADSTYYDLISSYVIKGGN